MANSSSGTIGTSVTVAERADTMINMLRVTRSFVLHHTAKSGDLIKDKPAVWAKSKMTLADEAKMRKVIKLDAPKLPTPVKGTLPAKPGYRASIVLVKEVFKNLTGFPNPMVTLATPSSHKRHDFGCMACGSLDHYYTECKHAPGSKKKAIKMLIEVAKKTQNTGALAAANTDVASFEEAVRSIYN